MIKAFIKLYLWAENIWFKLPQKLRFLLVGGFNTVFAITANKLYNSVSEGIDNIASHTVNAVMVKFPIFQIFFILISGGRFKIVYGQNKPLHT